MQDTNQLLTKQSFANAEAKATVAHKGTDRDLSFADIHRMLKRRKIPIACFAVLIMGLAALYTYTQIPIYEGVARLRIDPNGSTFELKDLDKPEPEDASDKIKTEVEIIRSNTVSQRVIDSLGLGGNPKFAGADAERFRGKEVAELQPAQRRGLLDHFAENLTVKLIPTTQVVEIRFRNPDPALAASIANAVIDQYMQRNVQARLSGNAQMSEWLSQQTKEIRANTAEAQQKLADFQREHNFLGGDEQHNIVIDRLRELNQQLTQAEADRIEKQGRYLLANGANPELMATASQDPTLQALLTRAAELKEEYAQLDTKFGDGYPKLSEVTAKLQSVISDIDGQRKQIKTRLSNDYAAASKTEDLLRRAFEKQKTEAYQLDENAAQYSVLRHEVEAGQQLCDTLQLKMKEADIASGLTSSSVMVIDRAEFPSWPVQPRKTFDLALGVCGGIFGGLLLGLLLDAMDDRLNTSEEFATVTDLPELSTIPLLESPIGWTEQISPGDMPGISNPIFTVVSLPEPTCPDTEAYSTLCSVILLRESETCRSLVVTSAMPGEGKSSVSLNLAIALAQRDRHVLFVDADMRGSSIQMRLGSTPGLSNMLETGQLNLLRYRPVSRLSNLHMIPAGVRPAAPTDLLDSKRMRELRDMWIKQYDHVIFDSPPVLPFADALLLSSFADGVILVTRAELSRRKALLKARGMLANSGARVLGFVLNGVRKPEFYHPHSRYFRQLAEHSSNHMPAITPRG